MQREPESVGFRAITRSGALGVSLILSALAVSGCADTDRTVLRVVTYPWIPDAGEDELEGLTRFLEQDFEDKFPDIDLQLRPIIDSFGVYEIEADDGGPGTLVEWLTNEPVSSEQHGDQDGYHLVEVDTLVLGELVDRQLIATWPEIETEDWHDAGHAAVSIDAQIYGVPRMLCGHFIISREPAVTSASSVVELITELDALGTDTRKLSGSFLGSWNFPALYVDAWRDSYPDAPIAQAFGPEPGSVALDEAVMQDMKDLSERCSFAGENWCLDGTYDDYTDPARAAHELARGEAHALLGYSERLHHIVAESRRSGIDVGDLTIASIPMGDASHPILFADAFVMRQDCDQACRDAAMAFVHYMNAPETQEAIMLSRDSGEGLVPRYLLPATKSAMTDTALADDPFYVSLQEQIETGHAYPNQGFYPVKDAAECELLSFWDLEGCE